MTLPIIGWWPDLYVSPPAMGVMATIPAPALVSRYIVAAPAMTVAATVPVPTLQKALNAPTMLVTSAMPAPAITQTLVVSPPKMTVTAAIPVPTLPVLYDATGAGYTGTGTPSWLHAITGNGIVVFVSIFVNTSTPTVTASVGGTAMTQQGVIANWFTASGSYESVYAFVLQSPPTGSQTISVSISGATTDFITANSLSYYNVSGFGTAATSNTGTANPSMSVSSATGQMVAQAFGDYTTTFSAYSQTQRYNKPYSGSVNLSFVMGDAPGASSVTFSATNTHNAGGIAIPVL